MGIFQHVTDTRPTQPLQMEKCASNLVSAPLVLILQPRPLTAIPSERIMGALFEEA